MFLQTPSLVGVEAADASEVIGFLRHELGLSEKGRLAGALAACPPMLMYHAYDNLRKKVICFRTVLSLCLLCPCHGDSSFSLCYTG